MHTRIALSHADPIETSNIGGVWFRVATHLRTSHGSTARCEELVTGIPMKICVKLYMIWLAVIRL